MARVTLTTNTALAQAAATFTDVGAALATQFVIKQGLADLKVKLSGRVQIVDDAATANFDVLLQRLSSTGTVAESRRISGGKLNDSIRNESEIAAGLVQLLADEANAQRSFSEERILEGVPAGTYVLKVQYKSSGAGGLSLVAASQAAVLEVTAEDARGMDNLGVVPQAQIQV